MHAASSTEYKNLASGPPLEKTGTPPPLLPVVAAWPQAQRAAPHSAECASPGRGPSAPKTPQAQKPSEHSKPYHAHTSGVHALTQHLHQAGEASTEATPREQARACNAHAPGPLQAW